jgi:hypothetical protein
MTEQLRGTQLNRNMMFSILTASLVSACATTPAQVWIASTTTDPITSVSRCVVAAPDSFNTGTTYFTTRVGALYPVVENNSQLGVLVGVSSGGTIRMPVGDIVWRIDDKPFRTLRMIDNPAVAGQPALTMPTDPAQKAMHETVSNAYKLAQQAASTATVASGARAKELLAEMMAGKSLIFRRETAAPAYGLPSSAPYSVGQYTSEGQRPIPIDESFHQSLAACGIR